MWKFKLEVVEKTVLHIWHVVLPLWIPKWFWRDFLFENDLKQISQENWSLFCQGELQVFPEICKIQTKPGCLWAIWAFKFETVERCLLQIGQRVLPLWTPKWFWREFLFENDLRQISQENCLLFQGELQVFPESCKQWRFRKAWMFLSHMGIQIWNCWKMLLANGAESFSFVLVDMIVTRVVCSKNFFFSQYSQRNCKDVPSSPGGNPPQDWSEKK